MADDRGFYCGTNKIPKGMVLGTPQQCVNTRQVRYYGKVAINPKLLIKKVKVKTADDYRKAYLITGFEVKDLLKEYDNLKLKLGYAYKDYDTLKLTDNQRKRLEYKIVNLELERLYILDKRDRLVKRRVKARQDVINAEKAEKEGMVCKVNKPKKKVKSKAKKKIPTKRKDIVSKCSNIVIPWRKKACEYHKEHPKLTYAQVLAKLKKQNKLHN